MSILSAIGQWFKRTFGKSTASPADYRRLSKAELKKAGLSEKSERFVHSDIKRITKTTRTVSKRAVETARLNKSELASLARSKPGQKVSKEAVAKALKPVSVERIFTGGEKVTQKTYRMPLSREAFDKRLAQIKKENPDKSQSEKTEAHIKAIYSGGDKGAAFSRLRYLDELSYEDGLDDAYMDRKYKGSGKIIAAEVVVRVYH